MHKVVEHTKADFAMVRTGRASPALVEKIRVDYYGSEVPLQQIAGFSVPEPRVLVVNPYDKGAMKAVERALISSDLGINPSNDGRCSGCVPRAQRGAAQGVREDREASSRGRTSGRAQRPSCDSARPRGAGARGRHLFGRPRSGREELENLTHEQIAEIDRLLSHKERELLEL